MQRILVLGAALALSAPAAAGWGFGFDSNDGYNNNGWNWGSGNYAPQQRQYALPRNYQAPPKNAPGAQNKQRSRSNTSWSFSQPNMSFGNGWSPRFGNNNGPWNSGWGYQPPAAMNPYANPYANPYGFPAPNPYQAMPYPQQPAPQAQGTAPR